MESSVILTANICPETCSMSIWLAIYHYIDIVVSLSVFIVMTYPRYAHCYKQAHNSYYLCCLINILHATCTTTLHTAMWRGIVCFVTFGCTYMYTAMWRGMTCFVTFGSTYMYLHDPRLVSCKEIHFPLINYSSCHLCHSWLVSVACWEAGIVALIGVDPVMAALDLYIMLCPDSHGYGRFNTSHYIQLVFGAWLTTHLIYNSHDF